MQLRRHVRGVQCSTLGIFYTDNMCPGFGLLFFWRARGLGFQQSRLPRPRSFMIGRRVLGHCEAWLVGVVAAMGT